MSLLDRIVESKKAELAELRQRRLPSPPPLVRPALQRELGQPLHLITEFKRRSPSAGELSSRLGLVERVRAYERGGASMLSILCDGPFFGGSFADLEAARQATSLPLLCKEFILDECQLDAARAYGAGAALLIVRCLAPEQLARLVRACEERELLPLVEVTNELEIELAVSAGAQLLGVNARDLDTLALDGARASQVLESVQPPLRACHFSGVKSAEAVTQLARGPAVAALIGEALMRQDDPLPLLQGFVQAARAAVA